MSWTFPVYVLCCRLPACSFGQLAYAYGGRHTRQVRVTPETDYYTLEDIQERCEGSLAAYGLESSWHVRTGTYYVNGVCISP